MLEKKNMRSGPDVSEIFAPQKAYLAKDASGNLLMRAEADLNQPARTTGDWLTKWASQTPQAIFIAERSGDGWRRHTYEDAFERVRQLAAKLLTLDVGPERPIMFLSGKSVDHGLLMLAAQYVGIPTVAIAEQYSLLPGAHDRLRHVVNIARPGLLFVDDTARFAAALGLDELADIDVVALRGQDRRGGEGGHRRIMSYTAFEKGARGIDVAAAHARVSPKTLAKLLFTSGSTSMPKAVRTSHEMLCVNQQQIAQIWPYLTKRPPRLVDWLPWNHTFGGSHNVNLMLSNGGSLYLDDGLPTKQGIGRTIENVREIGQTVSFNVPIAFSLMADEMHKDKAVRKAFFSELDLIFYAAAAMPQTIWDDLKDLAIKERGFEPMMSSGWGATETAPSSIMVHAPMKRAGAIGIPLPGVTTKLVPLGGGRFELRVKGANVMDGYYGDDEKTAAAFDEEGYYMTGDAVRFFDISAPSDGMYFDGRIAEDFKLMTGTWVHVSKLRTEAVSRLAPLVADMVITGHDRTEVGALIFVDPAFLDDASIKPVCRDGMVTNRDLLERLETLLAAFAEQSTGSSTRISRALILADPPSLEAGEITQKGNLNQNMVLTRRADIVDRLYDDDNAFIVRI
ncbi:MAG: feruloyl-CoA synthase [Fimbriimonadaceae bacterium]|nr:feruloyl-CoA synthase [Alphaproteobacteria bacterium]